MSLHELVTGSVLLDYSTAPPAPSLPLANQESLTLRLRGVHVLTGNFKEKYYDVIGRALE